MNRPLSRATGLFCGSDGEQRIVVFVKATHRMPMQGPMRRSSVDLPLTFDTISEGPSPEVAIGCTVQETDLWESKPWTDVVVRGHVRSPEGRMVTGLDASVRIGDRCKWVRVHGDRRVHTHEGRLYFGEPEPFDAIELSWRRAYGGIDLTIPHELPCSVLDLFRLFSPEQHPGAYPRNPAGRGWLLSSDPLDADGLRLPNFEHHGQELTPERLVVGDPRLWPRAPIPAGFGWWRQGWFPRSTLLGLPDLPFVDDPRQLPEVASGWVDADIVREPKPDVRFQSGASPGLRFAELAGGAPIELHGFSARGSISSSLPADQPKFELMFERRRLEARVHLSTVELLPDAGLANLVWRAVARPPVTLPATLPRPGQRTYDQLAGLDVLVDGERVPNELVDLGE